MNPDEEQNIPLPTASVWTANYRTASPSNTPIAHFYGKDAIQAILDQEDCTGLRIYYALDNNGKKQLIIVGADDDENDLYEGVIVERGYSCPANCGAENPLNS